MPVLYAILTGVFFVITWPSAAHINHYVGVLVTMLAFCLWLVARVQLGNAFSIGAKANYLVTSGLYSKLRHPVYYFSILAVVGIGIYIWSLLVLIPITLLVGLELYRINKEEKVLSDKFGEKYAAYKAKTWF
jgi:protein-S-isoprenylcysteine O-methyltransferase Ste14